MLLTLAAFISRKDLRCCSFSLISEAIILSLLPEAKARNAFIREGEPKVPVIGVVLAGFIALIN